MMDITVFGLVAGSYLIEDIGMDVPCGAHVTIPADKALRSKDLWRGINQRLIFQVSARPNAIPQITESVGSSLQDRASRLAAENEELRARLLEQQAEVQRQQIETQRALTTQSEQMTQIVEMLRAGLVVGAAPLVKATAERPAAEDYVSGDAPTFIPGTITPENAEARIDTKEESSENASVTGAAGKLRALRQKPKGS
jgi:regulator of replication initiation timing